MRRGRSIHLIDRMRRKARRRKAKKDDKFASKARMTMSFTTSRDDVSMIEKTCIRHTPEAVLENQ